MGHLKKCKQASVDDWRVLRPKRRGGVQACCSTKKGSQSALYSSISSLITRFLSGKTVNLLATSVFLPSVMLAIFFQTKVSSLCVIWTLLTLNNNNKKIVFNLLSDQHT